MEHFIKANWFKVGVLLLVLIAASSVSYYYLVSKPEQDKAVLQQQTSTQDQAQAQATAQAQQLQDCVANAKQDFANSYANLCTFYQTNQNQLGNPNWQCPLKLYGSQLPAYQTMVKQEEDAISLCSILYK